LLIVREKGEKNFPSTLQRGRNNDTASLLGEQRGEGGTSSCLEQRK